MHQKKWNPLSSELNCSESKLQNFASKILTEELGCFSKKRRYSRVWVLLEGPLGAGKSRLVSEFLSELRIERPAQGSPTFALMHQYSCAAFQTVIHADLYRIERERELEDIGFWELASEENTLCLIEWSDRVPELFQGLSRMLAPSTALIKIELALASSGDQNRRDLRASRWG